MSVDLVKSAFIKRDYSRIATAEVTSKLHGLTSLKSLYLDSVAADGSLAALGQLTNLTRLHLSVECPGRKGRGGVQGTDEVRGEGRREGRREKKGAGERCEDDGDGQRRIRPGCTSSRSVNRRPCSPVQEWAKRGSCLDGLSALQELDLTIDTGRRGGGAPRAMNHAIISGVGGIGSLKHLAIEGLWFSGDAHLGHLTQGNTRLARLCVRGLSVKQVVTDAGDSVDAFVDGFR